MIGIVIVAHGGFARELLAVLQHVVGKTPGIVAIEIAPDDDCRSKQLEINAAVESVDEGQGVIVVTDMFGGTPSNLALGACHKEKRTVIFGANLPMLVKLAKARHMPLEDAVATALTAGRKYINSVSGLAPQPAQRLA